MEGSNPGIPNPPSNLQVNGNPLNYVRIVYYATCPLNLVQQQQAGEGVFAENFHPSKSITVDIDIVTTPGGAHTPISPVTLGPIGSATANFCVRCTQNLSDNNTYSAEITGAIWM